MFIPFQLNDNLRTQLQSKSISISIEEEFVTDPMSSLQHFQVELILVPLLKILMSEVNGINFYLKFPIFDTPLHPFGSKIAP